MSAACDRVTCQFSPPVCFGVGCRPEREIAGLVAAVCWRSFRMGDD